MANTTNLNLEKPIGTDQALVSVINSNMDKIDNYAGSTNQALSKVDTAHNFGQYTSLDTFKNDLLTFMRNVASFKTVAIQFVFTQTVAPFVAWSTFSGYAHCIQNGSTSLYFSCDVTSNNGEDISIGYSNGTWNINKLAPNSDVTVTAYSGTTIVESSVKRIGDLVSGTVVFKMDASATTWKNAFQVSPAPKGSDTYAPCILTNNGQYLGMCKFYNNTAVQIYPLNAITASGQTVSVTFSYAVN